MRHTGRKRESRFAVFTTALIATLLFAAALAGALGLRALLPARQLRLAEKAVASGDTSLARELSEKYLTDEQKLDIGRKCDYADAQALFVAGKYDEAEVAFAALGSWSDSADRRRECVYLRSTAAMEAGDWDAAAAGFESLGGWSDALTQLSETRYRQASAERDSGHLAEALRLFQAVGDYSDAVDQARSLALTLTGETDPARALLMVSGLSESDIRRREAFVLRREQLPRDSLDVGFYHTVGLRRDGTVLAAGDDSFGQCEVSGWTDVTAVAAGAWHTVGLRSDGTVLAVGRNSENQCDVSGWSGVVQIAAADYATFGLTADGRVLHTGYNSYAEVDDWAGITYITGGSYALAGLRSDGSALVSHVTARSDELVELASVTVNTGYAVGLRSDGSVVSPFVELPGWKDILAVSSSGTGILGLRGDGTVASVFFRPQDDPGVDSVTGALAIAAGGTHCAFLLEDGSVLVLGGTGRGEGDTAGWDLLGGT